MPERSSSPHSNSPKENSPGFKSTLINLGWLVAWLLIMTFTLARMPQRPEEVPYSEFFTQVESDQVDKVNISERQIQYTLKTPTGQETLDPEATSQTSVTTPLSDDPDLSRILRRHGVEITATAADEKHWLVGLWSLAFPLLLLWMLWGSFANRMQGGPAALNVGKSKARIYAQGSTHVTFCPETVENRDCRGQHIKTIVIRASTINSTAILAKSRTSKVKGHQFTRRAAV